MMRQRTRRRKRHPSCACDNGGFLAGCLFPRVYQRHAGRLEVAHIARNDRQAVNKGGCCNESVAFGPWVGNVKLRAAQRDGRINGQDSIFKASQNVIVDPSSQDCTSRGVFALDQACSKFDF